MNRKFVITLMTSALAFTTPAFADEAAPAAGASAQNSMGDIVVTARRREESSLKVPVSVTAFGAETLRTKSINTPDDLVSHTPSLSITAGATWTITGAMGISQGASTKSSLKVAGTLIRSGATGTSVISLATSDAGLIEAATGTLDFSNKLSGTGLLKIDAGATLEADSTMASTLKVAFNGAGATLALKKPTGVAATISGYGVGDTIDLLKIAATGASVNGSNQLVIVNGATTVAKLQLTGSYAGATFNIASDGAGGTRITLLTAAMASPHAFIGAMAGLGGRPGPALIATAEVVIRDQAILAAPSVVLG